MTSADLRILASRFCDEHPVTKDMFSDEGRLYRLFLDTFIEWVKKRERVVVNCIHCHHNLTDREGTCVQTIRNGVFSNRFHYCGCKCEFPRVDEDNVLQFNVTKERSGEQVATD